MNPHCEAYETSKVAVPSLRMNFTLWIGLRESNPSFRAGGAACCQHTQAEQTDRWLSPAHRPPSIVKEPARKSAWRQRLDSNQDPRVLEAPMLPLHHAAHSDVSIRS